MGLNYSYVLLVAKAKEPTLRAQLAAAGSVTELAAASCARLWLDFPLDETLLTYLLDTLRELEVSRGNQPGAGNWWEYPASFPSATFGRVGCIYFELLPRAYTRVRLCSLYGSYHPDESAVPARGKPQELVSTAEHYVERASGLS